MHGVMVIMVPVQSVSTTTNIVSLNCSWRGGHYTTFFNKVGQ